MESLEKGFIGEGNAEDNFGAAQPGLGWQSMGMKGCRRSTVHAEQCKQSRLAFLLSELSCFASCIARADSAGINHPHRKRRV